VSASEMTWQSGHAGALEESPLGIPSHKLAMWLFIMADGATFGAILFAYGFLRVGTPDWTKPFALWPSIANGCVMTVILLSSSLTMLGAVASARTGQAARCMRWIGATMALGTLFAILHLREWLAMIHEGWGLHSNPLGGSALVGSTFFGITGLHLLHVVSGVIAIGVVATLFRRGRLTAGHIETVGLYWHFVDLVWMFVFPLVYLLNAR
jgi:heme/copper-type cytochrome/quinol oxidase subunit 3